MKVNSISSSYFENKCNKSTKRQNFKSNFLSCDTFQKPCTSTISFGATTTLAQKLVPFEKDLIKKTIYLSPPDTKDFKDKVAFAATIEHEMTHALQECSADRISKLDLINDFLKSSCENKLELLPKMPQLFKIIDYNIAMPYIQAFQKADSLPVKIQKADEKIVLDIYKKATGLKFDDCVDYMIKWAMQTLNCGKNNEERKWLLKYVALNAKKECEAYKNQFKMAKELLNINSPTDTDLFVKMYEMFSKKCAQMAKANK